ncbi:MAG: hypothetical protein ACQESP_08855 [Candidatus Muiribacteriota bacterium]
MSSKRWTKEEEDFLKANYNKMSNKQLAHKFGVTTISVQRKLSRLSLIRQVQKKWTSEEEKYLQKNFLYKNDAELAKKFKVTPIAVKRKLNRLGLKRSQRKKYIKKETSKSGSKFHKKEKIKSQEKVKKTKDNKEKVLSKTSNKKEKEEHINLTPDIEIKKEVQKSPDYIKYSIHNKYSKDDFIFHEVFDDKGKVVDKQVSPEGYELVEVDFERNGLKLLVENIK